MEKSKITDNKTEAPLSHYLKRYMLLDPLETANRCGLEYDEPEGAFSIRIMGAGYKVSFPDFSIHRDNYDVNHDEYNVLNPSLKILIIRFLLEGNNLPSTGRFLSYHEIPWGEVYYSNFSGRCIQRLVRMFGKTPEKFRDVMISIGAEESATGDFSYIFEFINNSHIKMVLWQGDEEFSASAQIMFSDNFSLAFTAEDMAVVGDVSLDFLNSVSKRLDMIQENVKPHQKEEHMHSHSTEHPHHHPHAHAEIHENAKGHHHQHKNTKAVLNRLSRAIGHMEAIKKMVEDGRDCSEVLIQLSAVKSALNNTGKVILQDHIENCIVDAVESGDKSAIEELNFAIDRFMK